MPRVLKTTEFERWFRKLPDKQIQQRIRALIDRFEVSEQLVGDWKHLGSGISEIRIDSGPGYRIYLGRYGKTLVLLLLGGNKGSQDRDIRKAKALWKEWKDRYVR